MAGSQINQTLFAGWDAAAQSASQSNLASMMPLAVSLLSGAVMLSVLITGKNMMFGEIGLGSVATRAVRAWVIVTLLTAGAFNTYITTPLTQTLPNAIASAVSGGSTTTAGGAAWDGLIDATTNSAAHARTPMHPEIYYVGSLVAVWIAEMFTKLFTEACAFVWELAKNVVWFALPLICLLLPTWLFDRTRAWGERSVGFVLGLVLTQTLVLMVAATTVSLERQFFADFSNAVTATPGTTNPGFQTNAGNNTVWTEFGPIDPMTGTVPSGAGSVPSTVNTDAAVESVVNMMIAIFFGWLMLMATSTIAFLVVAVSGFSASGVVSNMVSSTIQAGSNATRAGRKLRA